MMRLAWRRRTLELSMDEYKPPVYLRNPHLQTILGTCWNAPCTTIGSVSREVTLPDGDRVVLHESLPERDRGRRPAVLLVHGLTGSHASGYMCRTAERLLSFGYPVFRLDLRGCGHGVRLARKIYNAGCSGDVRVAA